MEDIITDYKGNIYKSLTEMCNKYGLTVSCYKYRMKSWNNKHRALTEPVIKKNKIEIHCETGGKTKSKILEELGVSRVNYNELRKLGFTHEEAIHGKRGLIKDHKENIYRTEKDMCKAWNINYKTYLRRKHAGRDIEECLEAKRVRKRKENKSTKIAV